MYVYVVGSRGPARGARARNAGAVATRVCDGTGSRSGSEWNAKLESRISLEMAPSRAGMRRWVCGEEGDGRCDDGVGRGCPGEV
jgi:hypothetical protein